jgi:hypothetical protein
VLYNYAGRPDKTADIVHLLLEKVFTDNRAGSIARLGQRQKFHVVARNLDRDGQSIRAIGDAERGRSANLVVPPCTH